MAVVKARVAVMESVSVLQPRNKPLAQRVLRFEYIIRAGRRHGLPAFRVEERDEIVEARLRAMRSEEHTSELQSLMRISYAVFCLKKKKKKQEKHTTQPH